MTDHSVGGAQPAHGLPVLVDLVPGLAILATFVVLASDGGGYDTTVWSPATLFVLALLVVQYAGGGAWSPSKTAWVAMGALAAFCAWSYLSIHWATVGGDAWTGADRTVLYLAVFVVMVRWARNRVGSAMWIALFPLALATVGGATLARAIESDAPARLLVGSRLADPTGYPNATAALFLLGLWPALALSVHRQLPSWLRGLLLASAGVLVEISLLPQSRGAVYTLPIVLVVFLVLAPERLRAIGHILLVAAVTAVSLPQLLDVYRTSARDGDVHHAFVSATLAIAAGAAVLFAAGTALALLDLRWARSPELTRRLRLAATVAVCAGVIVGGAATLAIVGHPVDRVQSAWSSFKHGSEPQAGTSHFVGLGSNRYDFWRVAWNSFLDHPVAGVGADNYQVEYLAHRRSFEQPRYPHSLELRLLLGTGLIGTFLFAVFLGAAVWSVRRRPADPLRRAVQAAGAAVFVSWFVHGSVDWFWEFPALSVGAFAGLALAVAQRERRPKRVPTEGRAVRLTAAVAGVVALAGAAAAVTLPWLAERDVGLAAGGWRADPAAAHDRLETAARLNRLSDTPWLVAGAISTRSHDFPAARRYFLDALGRNPTNWYAELEVGVLDANLGSRAQAISHLEVARRLNPREELIRFALDRVRVGTPIAPSEIETALLRDANATVD
jgi:hypothetical protein